MSICGGETSATFPDQDGGATSASRHQGGGLGHPTPKPTRHLPTANHIEPLFEANQQESTTKFASFHPTLGNLPGGTHPTARQATSAAANRLNRLLGVLTGSALTTRKLSHCVSEVEPARQLLERGQIAVVAQPGIKKISCEVGALWLTQDGRGKDIVLEAGQDFQCVDHDRNACLLVYALSNAWWRFG